jgi:hypothetical protein
MARGATVWLVEIGKLDLPDKGDCVDWLAQHPQATASDLDMLPLRPYAKAERNESVRRKTKSQATRLIELVAHVSLFHNDDVAYARIPVNGHVETWPLRSKQFRDYLTCQCYLSERHSPNAQAIEDTVRTLSGKAQFECPKGAVYRRVAECNGAIYIDLCDSQWHVIEVTAHGWQVITESPVQFIRSPGMAALPEPVDGEGIESLWDYLNVAEPDRCLLLAWLVAALRPTGPYPPLLLQGEQDTDKSTVARVLRTLVDPSAVPLRTIPRNERDLMIAARNGWCIVLDNLSGLAPWLSDALCRIATGGGFATRELYTDTDEIIIEAQRPTILNGIDDIATRQDLIDRAIIINLEPISDSERKSETEFWESFHVAQQDLLGALLDRVSRALRELPNIGPPSLPRMADFAMWAMAAEPPEESGKFITAYQGNRQSALESGLEGSPVAAALREMMNNCETWTGTATDLLWDLSGYTDDRTQGLRSWPKSAQGLSAQLRRLATALRAVGIHIQHDREPGTGKRRVKVCKHSSHAS